MFKPLVSIVIPVYNGKNYLREAIDSALAQTYDNLEVIVVNDGSQDNGQTEAIARCYGDKIRYLKKENGGCASALNLGISQMRGDYFSWLSHDDVYLPNKIEYQINLLAGLGNKETILYGGWEVIDAKSNAISMVRPDLVYSAAKLNISLFPLLRGLLHGCAMLVPTHFFREIGNFDESLPSTQDYDLWFKFLRKAPIHYDSEILIKARVHSEQGTHRIEKHIDECNTLWSGFLQTLTVEEMCEMEDTPHRFMTRTAQFLANTPYDKACELANKLARDFLKETLISVVIPFRNRIDWTVEALKSAINQTHNSLEIILVDDGSTEPLTPLETIMQEDARIRLLKTSQGGPARARNIGVNIAKGIYIAFLDSDDCFHPEKIANQLQFMELNELSISHTSYERVDNKLNLIEVVPSGRFEGFVFPEIIYSCPIATPTVMLLARLSKTNPFPVQFNIGEDLCLWIRITREHELGGIDIPMSRVRIIEESTSVDTRKQLLGRLNVARFLVDDPELFQYGKPLRKLLQRSRWLVPNVDGEEIIINRGRKLYRGTSLPLKAIQYVSQHGIRAALRRFGLIRELSSRNRT